MLRGLVRWWFRLVMLPMTEWRKAKVNLYAEQSVHLVRTGTRAEVQKLRASLANLERLHRDAAASLAAHPAAASLIIELLRAREQELRRAAGATVGFADMREAAD